MTIYTLEQQFLKQATATLCNNLDTITDAAQRSQIRDILAHDTSRQSLHKPYQSPYAMMSAKRTLPDSRKQVLSYDGLEQVVNIAGKEILHEKKSFFKRTRQAAKNLFASAYSFITGKEDSLEKKAYHSMVSALAVGAAIKEGYVSISSEQKQRRKQLAVLEQEITQKKTAADSVYLAKGKALLDEKDRIQDAYNNTEEAAKAARLNNQHPDYTFVRAGLDNIYDQAMEGVVQLVSQLYTSFDTSARLENLKLQTNNTAAMVKKISERYLKDLRISLEILSDRLTPRNAPEEMQILIDHVYKDVVEALENSTHALQSGIKAGKKDKQTLIEDVEYNLLTLLEHAFKTNFEQRRKKTKEGLVVKGMGNNYEHYQQIPVLQRDNDLAYDSAYQEIASLEKDRLIPVREGLVERVEDADRLFIEKTAELHNIVLDAPTYIPLIRHMYQSIGCFDERKIADKSIVEELRSILRPIEEKKSWLASSRDAVYAGLSFLAAPWKAIPRSVYTYGLGFATALALSIGTFVTLPVPTNETSASITSNSLQNNYYPPIAMVEKTVKTKQADTPVALLKKEAAAPVHVVTPQSIPVDPISIPLAIDYNKQDRLVPVQPSVVNADSYQVITMGANAEIVAHGSMGEFYENGTWKGTFSIPGEDDLAKVLTSTELTGGIAKHSGKRSLLEQQASQTGQLPKMY